MKYELGDTPTVRKDLILNHIYGGQRLVGDMSEMLGKKVTIRYVDNCDYLIKGSGFNWTDEMFEPARLTTDEAIKALRNDPKAKYTDGNMTIWVSCKGYLIGQFRDHSPSLDGNLRIDATWVPVLETKEVSPLEAITAHCKGKEVYCMFQGHKKHIGDMYGEGVVLVEWISLGRWYVED